MLEKNTDGQVVEVTREVVNRDELVGQLAAIAAHIQDLKTQAEPIEAKIQEYDALMAGPAPVEPQPEPTENVVNAEPQPVVTEVTPDPVPAPEPVSEPAPEPVPAPEQPIEPPVVQPLEQAPEPAPEQPIV